MEPNTLQFFILSIKNSKNFGSAVYMLIYSSDCSRAASSVWKSSKSKSANALKFFRKLFYNKCKISYIIAAFISILTNYLSDLINSRLLLLLSVECKGSHVRIFVNHFTGLEISITISVNRLSIKQAIITVEKELVKGCR